VAFYPKTAKESLLKWKNKDAKEYALQMIRAFGEPDLITAESLEWKDPQRHIIKHVIVDESVEHIFPKPHRDYVYSYTYVDIYPIAEKEASGWDLMNVLAYVTGSIGYDGLKRTVYGRCGSLAANAVTLEFVQHVVDHEEKYLKHKKQAKKEYARRIKELKRPFWWEDKLNEFEGK
jgi:hypothetical protein